MKKYIPIIGVFIADYPIGKDFFIFFTYQIYSIGISTFFVAYGLLKHFNCL